MTNTNGHVRWPTFATLMVTIFCLILGTSSYVLSTTISDREFKQFEKRIDKNLEQILDEIKGLKK